MVKTRSIPFLTYVLAALALPSCATIMPGKAAEKRMETSAAIPAAEAKLKLKNEDNQNTKVELKVERLAEPSEVVQGTSTYVVWVRPAGKGAAPQNMGALRVGRDLKAELDTVVPYTDFNLFITAEKSPTVTNPTTEPLLWTEIGRGDLPA